MGSLAMAARKVDANLVASAFFKYTTWMSPLADVLLGRSSFSIKALAWLERVGLAARKMMALLLGSAIKVVL